MGMNPAVRVVLTLMGLGMLTVTIVLFLVGEKSDFEQANNMINWGSGAVKWVSLALAGGFLSVAGLKR